ncbi:MAG TPA: GNAT family N-acetyltransferase [Thermohalobaculum sp.]|nr:GNAT family N-acetyltransferase [Thermohalobaculum sp.]
MPDPAIPLEVETERLLLRQWRDSDGEAFAAMNGDPKVMRYFKAQRSRAESDGLLERLRKQWREDGFSYYAVEAKGGGLIGFCGLSRADFPAHLLPCVEIGWRLVRGAWGKGYATEAARASLAHGFGQMALPEVLAFTVAGNARSRAVMERLGMRCNPSEDFDDPDEPVNSPIRPLVIYRLSREEWGR